MRFTVGYTIFNKVQLIPKIIWGIKDAFNEEDEIIFLFDNCTDGSLDAFQQLKGYLPVKPKIIITTQDLYEIKANNKILREATNDVIVLFQDDIVNHDKELKSKIQRLIETYGNSLGLLGGRSGYELTGDPNLPEKSYGRASNWEHLEKQYGERLPEGGSKERTILNRGPVVFTRQLLNEVGYFDEELYPQWGDDMDYCCRAKFKYGKKNVVFQCNVESQLRWGTTHSGKSKVQVSRVINKNWDLFISRWGEDLRKNYENIVKS